MRKPTCDLSCVVSKTPGRKLLTRGAINFSKVLPPETDTSPLWNEVVRRFNLKLFTNRIEDVSFFFILKENRCVWFCQRVCDCVRVCACVCDTVWSLKRNGLGFQQKQQLMIKRFYCQALCKVTIIMLRSFEQPETLQRAHPRVAAGSKMLWHLILKQKTWAGLTPDMKPEFLLRFGF